MRLTEKGGTRREIPCHHTLEQYVRDYLNSPPLALMTEGLLFPCIDRRDKTLNARRLTRAESYAMVQRRLTQAGLSTKGFGNHTFRGTGITVSLTLARSSNMRNALPGMPTRRPPGYMIVAPMPSPSTKSNASTSNPAVRTLVLHPAHVVSTTDTFPSTPRVGQHVAACEPGVPVC